MEWAEHQFGPARFVADHSWPHGEARALALDVAAGPIIVKAFRQQGHFDRETHHKAAQLLRRLHDFRPAVPDRRLGSRILASFDRYAARGFGLIGAGDLAQVRRKIERIGGQPIPVVGCHGDFSPRNWLVDAAIPRFASSISRASRWIIGRWTSS